MGTSFKRIHGWQEFESEAWFAEYARFVVCRAFTSSQSADAHRILFRRIFEIVEADTGQQVQFRHIHGNGWDTVIGDEHRGKALDLGLRLQEICRDMPGYCSIDWTKPLHELTPYKHLKRCFCVCFQLPALFDPPDPLPNFDGMLAIIRQEGKKAQDWSKDKLAAGGCMLAAVYCPASQIPIDVWKASPNTTNGNEQSYRNIYRDGRKLSLVPGAMHGFQYDHRAMVVNAQIAVQRRTVKAHDAALEKAYNIHSQLVDTAASQAKSLKRTKEFRKATETALKRLRDLRLGRVPIPPSLNTPAGSNSQRSPAQHHIYSTLPNVASGSQPYIHSDHAADDTIPSSMQYTFKVDLLQGPAVAEHPGPARPTIQRTLPELHMLPTQQQTFNPNMLPPLQSPVDQPFPPPAAYGHPFQMHYGSQSQPPPGSIGRTDNVPSTSPSFGETPYPISLSTPIPVSL
ncbi:hypothetical protein M422DRAFT_269933 [Sphaerobolus stellatus SS14]|uniref:Uncharacterized protein n=1 Tax=Sphaerobolus stellatus (strain SS14) TaxID=990650 RepID=A0A0C9UU43_SPHS4|nr:hypothetical protein M422DRAFT_269933 [Sphaerobolus stellatus SS14]